MDLLRHFQMQALYNRVANERIYEACSKLSDEERREQRKGSFGSIHALLNHILLADRIWMSRFEGAGQTTPPLNTVLYDEFDALRQARVEQDARMEAFFAGTGPEFLTKKLNYRNSKGIECSDDSAMAVAHLFNHQTHHRGQIHVWIAQTAVQVPSLDLHRIVNP
jgi:uncharacterized damage-inducible protein DinB